MKLGIMPIVTQQSQRYLSLETSNKFKSQDQSSCNFRQLAFGSASPADICGFIASGTLLAAVLMLQCMIGGKKVSKPPTNPKKWSNVIPISTAKKFRR